MESIQDRYKRVGIEEAKQFWFRGDLTVWVTQEDEFSSFLALPRVEVISGLEYIKALKSCRNYADYDAVSSKYEADPNRSRFFPQIFRTGQLPDFQEKLLLDFLKVDSLTSKEISNFYKEVTQWEWKNMGSEDQSDHPFTFHQDYADLTKMPYRWSAESADSFEGFTHWVQWTATWMPIEITKKTGMLTNQYLDFEENPIYVYSDLAAFVQVWESFGFKVEIDSPEMLEFAELAFERY